MGWEKSWGGGGGGGREDHNKAFNHTSNHTVLSLILHYHNVDSWLSEGTSNSHK